MHLAAVAALEVMVLLLLLAAAKIWAVIQGRIKVGVTVLVTLVAVVIHLSAREESTTASWRARTRSA